ncbi:MAG: SMC-Scp complex subunit ScpB [Candidatus Heimdallarchaeota archaeon]|nr:SMC-Scp complex subunit ScpB [Candidatus Heimdallarchaeota archaeon]
MNQQFPFTEEEKQMQRIKNQQLIEATLYLAGRPVLHTEIAQITGIQTADVTTLIKDLQDKYKQHFSCFEIIELPGKKFVFQVRVDIGENVKEITLQPLLTLAELRTLAMIAYQQPIMQSTVVKVRGQQSYIHVKNLIRNGFIKSNRVKQTLELRTTPMFSDYFGLSHDIGVLKRQLGWRTKRIIKDKKHERGTYSIENFMARIGIESNGSDTSELEDIEQKINMDKNSAREMFPSMLDNLEGPDPWENGEEGDNAEENIDDEFSEAENND